MSIELLGQAVVSTRAILAGAVGSDMDRPTPCASWDVRALVNHIVGSTTWFAETVESGAAPGSEHGEYQSDVTTGDILATYDAGTRRALDAFGAPGALERILKLPFGEMPAGAFLMMASGDQFQHGWDLAKATGQSTDLNPELAGQLLGILRAAIPEGFRGPDRVAPFGPVVPVADDAPPADRLAGFLGRQP